MARARAHRGFTLAEMLVVCLIIGILATMAVASLAKARVQARESKAAATLPKIGMAYVAYMAKQGVFPHWGPGMTYADPQALWTDLVNRGYLPSSWDTYTPDINTGMVFGPFVGYALEIPAYEPAAGRTPDTYFRLMLHPSGYQEGYMALIIDPSTDRPTLVPLSNATSDIGSFSTYRPQN